MKIVNLTSTPILFNSIGVILIQGRAVESVMIDEDVMWREVADDQYAPTEEPDSIPMPAFGSSTVYVVSKELADKVAVGLCRPDVVYPVEPEIGMGHLVCNRFAIMIDPTSLARVLVNRDLSI